MRRQPVPSTIPATPPRSPILPPPPPQLESVSIYRDRLGVPHVYADTDEAVVYGIGRIQARDRPLEICHALAAQAGKLSETLGRFPFQSTVPSSFPDLHLIQDRAVLSMYVPDRSRSLYQSYRRASIGSEEQVLCRLLHAFLLGVRDELSVPGRISHLVAFYSRHQQWIHPERRLTPQQYRWLFERIPEPWEPLAILLQALGGALLGEFIKLDDVLPMDRQFTRTPPLGSNSYGFHSIATDDDRVYVIGDEHQPKALYHVARFKARRGTLDGAGAFQVGGPFPFFNVAKNVAWAPTFGQTDTVDELIYECDWSRKRYLDERRRSRDLRLQWFELRVRTGQQTWQSVWFPEYYLQADSSAPGNAPLKVMKVLELPRAHAPASQWPDHLYTKRIWGLEDGNPAGGDPRFEPLKLLYRLHQAQDAEEALGRAFGLLSTRHLNFIIGSGIAAPGSGRPDAQVIALPSGRCAYRFPESPLDSSFVGPVLMSGHPEKMWGVHDPNLPYLPHAGAVFHPISHFPTLRLHERYLLPGLEVRGPQGGPGRASRETNSKWVVNNNVAPQWYFGRLHPFPSIGPFEERWRWLRLRRPLVALPASTVSTQVPYQKLPWFTTQPSLEGSFPSLYRFFTQYPSRLIGTYDSGYGHPFFPFIGGAIDLRQEWLIRLVRRAYESAIYPGISEADLRTILTDCRDPTAYFVHNLHNYDTPDPQTIPPPRRLTWLEDLQNQLPGRSTVALVQEFRDWIAMTEGDTATADPRFSQTPAKWICFWYVFTVQFAPYLGREGINAFAFQAPFREMFLFPSEHVRVRESARQAAVQTLLVFSAYPQTLGQMQRAHVNFTGHDFPALGAGSGGHSVGFAWIVDPIGTRGIGSLPTSRPRSIVITGSRLPAIIGLRKRGDNSHRVFWMNQAQLADDYTMPEWAGQPGLFEASVRRWAAREMYELPMIEMHQDLQGFVYKSNYDFRLLGC